MKSYVRAVVVLVKRRPTANARRCVDQLWAPWRLDYVAAPSKAAASADCFLCRGLAENSDRANLIVRRTSQSAVVLNRFPYNNGHLLVAPLAHKSDLGELTDDELL